MMPLRIRFVRLDPRRHRCEYRRGDGSEVTVVLETRSTLYHDLVHFALEQEAAIERGFFGRIAAGEDPSALDGSIMQGSTDEPLHEVERVTGPLQGWLRRGGGNASQFVTRLREYGGQTGVPAPDWLDADLVDRVRESVRRLAGRFEATPFGEPFELEF